MICLFLNEFNLAYVLKKCIRGLVDVNWISPKIFCKYVISMNVLFYFILHFGKIGRGNKPL
jgi:hypothetical protein